MAAYKNLSQVERAFRSLKTVDLDVRPVFHDNIVRVRAQVFLCMLAYYVERWMRGRLKSMLLFGLAQQPWLQPPNLCGH